MILQNLFFGSVIFLRQDMIEHDKFFIFVCQFFVYLNSGMWVGTGSGGTRSIPIVLTPFRTMEGQGKRLFMKNGNTVEGYRQV